MNSLSPSRSDLKRPPVTFTTYDNNVSSFRNRPMQEQSKRPMLEVGIFRPLGPARLPNTMNEGGVTGEDEAQAAGYNMMRDIRIVIQASKTPRANDYNFIADIHRGTVLFARAEVQVLKYTDTNNRNRAYSLTVSQADVFAIHQLNIVIMKRCVNGVYSAGADPQAIVDAIMKEFNIIGVCMTDVKESGEENARFQALNVSVHGEAEIRNHFSEKVTSGLSLCYALRMVPVQATVAFSPFTRTTAPVISIPMYDKTSGRQIRYVPRYVPFVRHKLYSAAPILCHVDDDRIVKGHMITLGYVLDDPLTGRVTRSKRYDANLLNNPDAMELSRAAYDARDVAACPDLTILSNIL